MGRQSLAGGLRKSLSARERLWFSSTHVLTWLSRTTQPYFADSAFRSPPASGCITWGQCCWQLLCVCACCGKCNCNSVWFYFTIIIDIDPIYTLVRNGVAGGGDWQGKTSPALPVQETQQFRIFSL
ncbi:MAG: hypothetical protein FWC97_02670 [Treponema sp.]|nr:hypothetical protein [Treponema sp.]